MKLWRLLLAVTLAATGCNRSIKVSNPVVGPAPPRVRDAEALAQKSEAAAPGDSQAIEKVAFSDGQPGTGKKRALTAIDPVARVNGKTIFAGDILGEQMMQFEAAKGKAPPEEIRKVQEGLLKDKLQDYIDQQLMVDAVRVKLKPEQLEGIDKQLDAAFEENMVPELMKSTKSQSVAELEQLLQKYGLSLPQMRKRWGDQQIALQWIKTKAGNDPKFSREDLIAAYEKRLKDYTVVGQVKWQQIQVNTAKHGGDRNEARAVLLQAMKALVAGESFDDVARKYSEAPSAKEGGHWDWTQTDSLASKTLAQKLDTLKVNEVSEIIEDGKTLQIVRVTNRRERRMKPFEEIQDELKATLIEEDRKRRTESVIEELRKSGVVETILDEEITS